MSEAIGMKNLNSGQQEEEVNDCIKGVPMDQEAFAIMIVLTSIYSLIRRGALPKLKIKKQFRSITVRQQSRTYEQTDRPVNIYEESVNDEPVIADMPDLVEGVTDVLSTKQKLPEGFLFDKKGKMRVLVKGVPGRRTYFSVYYMILCFFFGILLMCFHKEPDRAKLQLAHLVSSDAYTSHGVDNLILKLKDDIIFDLSPIIGSISFYSLSALFRFGALYSPCIPIFHSTYNDNFNNEDENTTGCCLKRKLGKADLCFQSIASRCEQISFTFFKDVQCGEKSDNRNRESHANCRIIRRPCCLMTGVCKMSDEEECLKISGIFNTDKVFCSQVNCFDKICGVQIVRYSRIFLSLFMTSGFVHSFFVLVFMFFVGQLTEYRYGTLKVSVMFLSIGIIDNILFAIIYPELVTVGPIASQTAMFTLIFFELFANAWKKCFSANSSFALKNYLLNNIVGMVFIGLTFIFTPYVKCIQLITGFIGGFLFYFCFIPFSNEDTVRRNNFSPIQNGP